MHRLRQEQLEAVLKEIETSKGKESFTKITNNYGIPLYTPCYGHARKKVSKSSTDNLRSSVLNRTEVELVYCCHAGTAGSGFGDDKREFELDCNCHRFC